MGQRGKRLCSANVIGEDLPGRVKKTKKRREGQRSGGVGGA